MIQEIEVHGNEDLVLSVSLHDILSCIKEGKQLYWKLLWVEAVGHIQGKTMLEFEEDVKKSIHGYLLSWEELLTHSKSFEWVNEIILIGNRNQLMLKRYNTDTQMYSACELTIELIDSSYWVIHSSNNNYIDSTFYDLKGVKTISSH